MMIKYYSNITSSNLLENLFEDPDFIQISARRLIGKMKRCKQREKKVIYNLEYTEKFQNHGQQNETSRHV